jgi:3',5'-nucleoside bisphosphate phosphatase
MEKFRADLHVHTVLSPCGSIEMIPPLIVQTAIERQIDLIAITDHNTSANVKAVQRAAEGSCLTVLAGMELQTREEVHVLCLFDSVEQLLDWQGVVDQFLPDIPNNPDYFGDQFIVDETGDYLGTEPRLLISSVQMSIEDAIFKVHQLGGLAIPAHINRKAFGLFYNLGFVPVEPKLEALEISRHISPMEATIKYPQIRGYPLIQSGDVHHLSDFLGSTYFWVESPTIAEIRLALGANNGRKVEIMSNITEKSFD